jgi:hypothetical protein
LRLFAAVSIEVIDHLALLLRNASPEAAEPVLLERLIQEPS